MERFLEGIAPQIYLPKGKKLQLQIFNANMNGE